MPGNIPSGRVSNEIVHVVDILPTLASVAGYKVPKHFLVRENLHRAPNGKADFKGTLAYAKQQLGLD